MRFIKETEENKGFKAKRKSFFGLEEKLAPNLLDILTYRKAMKHHLNIAQFRRDVSLCDFPLICSSLTTFIL